MRAEMTPELRKELALPEIGTVVIWRDDVWEVSGYSDFWEEGFKEPPRAYLILKCIGEHDFSMIVNPDNIEFDQETI